MKLSKKNAARQRVLQRAIGSGKMLGGLLVGLSATTVVGGSNTPASTMGSYPRPQRQANAMSENAGEFTTGGVILVPEPPPQPKPNAVREQPGKTAIMGKLPVRGGVPPPLPPGQHRVKYGDTLSKIAKTYDTSVAELKRLNGFDDKRANNLIAGEIIKVPQPKPNAANERPPRRPKGVPLQP